MFKCHLIKLNHRILSKTYSGVPVFIPDYNATVLVAKVCTNNYQHSI
jgi:hypothetical protein